MNDEDRRQWVSSDEGLWDLWRTSRQRSMMAWIRKHRAEIDEVARTVLNSERPAHYLKYGGQEGGRDAVTGECGRP